MIPRLISHRINEAIQNQLSFFLLGPRQTGKTTLVTNSYKSLPHLAYNLMETGQRIRFEKDPSLIIAEVLASQHSYFFIDEVQKVPEILDNIQILIDREQKTFALTGSSARKLKRKGINLLPGRVLSIRMDPLVYPEYHPQITHQSHLKRILKYGELPRIFSLVQEGKEQLAEELLYAYVTTYLEEEIRAESLVRKIGAFSKFLKIAAEESGKIVSLRSLSQDLGIPHQTIADYYRILEDCLIVEKIESLTPSQERGKVVKAPKFIFFDLGVTNASAEVLGSGDFHAEYWGRIFEQWVGLTLLRYMRANNLRGKLFYWRDYSGREVDWIVEFQGQWIPIEVKWGENLKSVHHQHLDYFIKSHPEKAKKGLIVFTGTHSRKITENISAVTSDEFLDRIFKGLL